MATNKQSTIKAKITRIKANDKSTTKKAITAKKIKSVSRKPLPKVLRPLAAIGTYFKGAWYELREVRWPTRGATWSLVGAVLVFTAFIALLILLLDALYKFLFEIILK